MAAAPRLAGGGPPVGADELADVQRVLERDGAGLPWDAFAASRLIGEREAQALRRYDGKPEALQASLLDEVRGSERGRAGAPCLKEGGGFARL